MGFASRFTRRPLTYQRVFRRQFGTQRADFLTRDLARDAAIEQQDDEACLVGDGRAGDFLRRHAGAQGEAIHALGEQQQFEDGETELVRIVGRCREEHVLRLALRANEPGYVAEEALDEIAETQLLEILHLAPHDPFVHGFIERNQRGLEELCASPARQQFGKVILQLAHPMLREELDGGLDFTGQRRRVLDREAQHRLQHRLGQRHDGSCPPALPKGAA
jgi:hypothetical protein